MITSMCFPCIVNNCFGVRVIVQISTVVPTEFGGLSCCSIFQRPQGKRLWKLLALLLVWPSQNAFNDLATCTTFVWLRDGGMVYFYPTPSDQYFVFNSDSTLTDKTSHRARMAVFLFQIQQAVQKGVVLDNTHLFLEPTGWIENLIPLQD